MNFWNSLPLFRLIIPFILGIFFSETLFFDGLIAVSVCLFLFAILFHFLIKSYAYRWGFGIIIWFLMFTLGIYAVDYSTLRNEERYFANFLEEDSYLLLELNENPVEGLKSIRCKANVISVDGKKTTGKMLVYFDKDIDSLIYGSQIFTYEKPQLVPFPKNPYQFNYNTYLSKENIHHQLFLSSDHFSLIEERGGNRFFYVLNRFRQYSADILNNSGFSANQMTVLSALLLGDKSNMEYELRQTFINAGVMHILAVSGLHVGILFIVVLRLLSLIKQSYSLKILKLVIIISILWMYAFITSLSPSVMRAATMFSFFAISNFLGRTTNIYNTLAASAFLLLIIDPFMIYKIGFQLSYLAVLGIITIYPKIYNLINFRSLLLDYVWQLICVSIAAQVATFALSIYYFHQFPNYFLLANIMVLPLVPIIINLGLALFVCNTISFVSEPLVVLLKFAVNKLFAGIELIQSMPNSSTHFLFLDWYELVLIYAIIGTALLLVHFRKAQYFILVLSLLIVMQFFHLKEIVWRKNNFQLVFYSISGHTTFGFVRGDRGTYFLDETLIQNKKKQAFNLHNHWASVNLKEQLIFNLDTSFQSSVCLKSDHHIQIGNQRILLVDNTFELMTISSPIQIDYCLLSVYYPLDELLKTYQPELIILDGSLPFYTSNRIIQEAIDYGLKYHHLKQEGALIESIDS